MTCQDRPDSARVCAALSGCRPLGKWVPLCHAPRRVPISEAWAGEPFVSSFLHPSGLIGSEIPVSRELLNARERGSGDRYGVTRERS
jgi:hypothetical protein